MDDRITYLHEIKNNKKVQVLSIDGNIGSGKSTLVNNLKKNLKDYPNICFLDEPVEIWNTIKDKNGINILTNYYNNQKKYAFPFQMMAYISRLHLLKTAINSNKYDLIITERSVETDKRIFAKMLYDNEYIEEIEYQIYNMWFDEFIKELPLCKYIYMKTTPEIAKIRIEKRAREGENIPIEYLEKCHKYHDEWLNNLDKENVLILDGTFDINKNNTIINTWIYQIKYFCKLN